MEKLETELTATKRPIWNAGRPVSSGADIWRLHDRIVIAAITGRDLAIKAPKNLRQACCGSPHSLMQKLANCTSSTCLKAPGGQ